MRRILSVVTMFGVVVMMAVTGFTASPPEIIGMAESLAYGYSGDPFLGEVAPQDERILYIDLTGDMFVWDDGAVGTPSPLSASQLDKLAPRIRSMEGGAVKDIQINAHESRIEIELTRALISTKSVDFAFEVVPAIDGRSQSDYGVSFTGTLANPVYFAYAERDYADISDGEVLEAREAIRRIRLDAGAGVTISTRMMQDSRYYARASLSAGRDAYDTITLKTAGVPQSATVYLGREYQGYYVYNRNGKYLGRSDKELPLADRYYLSDQLRAAKDNEPPDREYPDSSFEPVQPIPAYPSNANRNPGTGGTDQASDPDPAPTDITEVILAAFALISAIVTTVIVPYIRSRTTAQQQCKLNSWVRIAVGAAEQLSKGSGSKVTDKKSYVLDFLRKKGFTADDESLDAMIEAAVYELNNGIVACEEVRYNDQ